MAEYVMEPYAVIRDTQVPAAKTTAPTWQQRGPAPVCQPHARQRTARHLFTQAFLSRKDLSVWKLILQIYRSENRRNNIINGGEKKGDSCRKDVERGWQTGSSGKEELIQAGQTVRECLQVLG